MFFSHAWDTGFFFTDSSGAPGASLPGTGFPHATHSLPAIYVDVYFTVTYATIGKKRFATRTNLASRDVPGTLRAQSSPRSLVASEASTTNTALIAALAAVAGVLCLAGVVFAVFMLHRRHRARAQKAVADSASASGDVLAPEQDFGVVTV
jgi:hypothetical protein